MPLTDAATKQLLLKKRVELVDQIELDVALWNELMNRSVLTKTQKEDIIRNDRNTSTQQKTLLLELLPKRGQDKFRQFCQALVSTEQDHVVTDVLGLDPTTLQREAESEAACAGGDQPAQNSDIENVPANSQTTTSQTTTTQVPTSQTTSLPMETSGCSDAPPLSCLPGGSTNHKRSPDPMDVSASPDKKVRRELPHEVEEDGIELTDSWGLAPEPVRTSTEAFYLAHRDPTEVYPMYLGTRGCALIINVCSVQGEPRRGTEVDNTHLIYLFNNLHFDVKSYSDQDGLTAAEIVAKAKAFFSLPQHVISNSAVLCVLSHGVSDGVYGTDGHLVPLHELYRLMNDCPGLDNKPKLVFLEACAGYNYDGGKLTHTTLHGEDQSDAKLPFMTDFFIGRPSQPGMRAHRNTVKGSWYVQAIVKVFSKYAATKSLPELMFKVNAAVARKESKCSDPSRTGKKQMPDQRVNLRRNLYFHPGIQRTHP